MSVKNPHLNLIEYTLRTRIDKLENSLEKAIECLEIYADPRHWATNALFVMCQGRKTFEIAKETLEEIKEVLP